MPLIKFAYATQRFLQDIAEWPENQILIPDWTYFHCPGATLVPHQFSQDIGEKIKF